MRQLLGLAFLLVGVGVLGWYGSTRNAYGIEGHVAGGAAAALATSVHGAGATVAGRDITLTGLADTEAERAALVAAAGAVEGRRVVIDRLEVLPVASPYVSILYKAPDGSLTAEGSVPSEALRREIMNSLGWGPGAAAMTLASGAPEGWAGLAIAAGQGMIAMDFGQAVITDGTLAITGTARGPAERAMVEAATGGVPPDALTLDVTLMDDGAPNVVTVRYDAVAGATVAGKLPPGMLVDDLAGVLGIDLAGSPEQGLLGDAPSVAPFAAVADWLTDFETLEITQGPDGTTITGTLARGPDLAAISAAIAAEAGEGVTLDLRRAAVDAAEGTRRTNAATGREQRLTGGFWLPVMSFAPSVETCTAEADRVLTGDAVTFLPGSDALDPAAVAAVDALAAVMLECTGAGGLSAVIGGHADGDGGAVANLRLSQARAAAVRAAVVARGVPPLRVRAVGYGEERPVAGNDTDEGMTLNHRMTVEWQD
jgi:OOP family OmpA-OmpF porin